MIRLRRYSLRVSGAYWTILDKLPTSKSMRQPVLVVSPEDGAPRPRAWRNPCSARRRPRDAPHGINGVRLGWDGAQKYGKGEWNAGLGFYAGRLPRPHTLREYWG